MSSVAVLYTPRLILRPFTLADAARVQELAGDKRIADNTARMPHPYPDGVAEKWIGGQQAAAQAGQAFTFAVTLAGTRTPGREVDPTDTGHVIGSIEIRALAEAGEASLGYWIGVAWWNKGFATEAARAVIDFAFARRGYRRVVAWRFAENAASGRVLEKAGLAATGETKREYLPLRGQSYDLVRYTLAREAWSRRRIVHRWKPVEARAMAST